MSLIKRGQEWYAGRLPYLGDGAAIVYRPNGGKPSFEWQGIISGERGSIEYDTSGDLLKLVRCFFCGAKETAINNGVTNVEAQATVMIDDVEWSIDPTQSHWGPGLVKLGLRRREISRFEEMEHHANAV